MTWTRPARRASLACPFAAFAFALASFAALPPFLAAQDVASDSAGRERAEGAAGRQRAELAGVREIHDSGGPLSPAQAAYDVTFYGLELEVFPETRSIRADAVVRGRILQPVDRIVLDLDTALVVRSVHELRQREAGGDDLVHDPRQYRHDDGLLQILSDGRLEVDEEFEYRIAYEGRPLDAGDVSGTWRDGWVWAETADGSPWIGTVSVLTGSDIWRPVKDHPGDEPDSARIAVRVPAGLVVAANGTLETVSSSADGRRVFVHRVAHPISNFSLTVNIAPYVLLEETYVSVSGDTFPVRFWVLPEHEEAGRRSLPAFLRHLRWFEETLGPYPFRAGRYGVAETPYLGMENQTIISYGSTFEDNEFGFDWLHFHELSHEWWGNKLTAADWKDWWLHESFGTYMEALYAEHLGGEEAYHRYIPDRPLRFANRRPVAPFETRTAKQIYGGDIYGKGAQILHTLRYLVGREALLAAFRAFQEAPAPGPSSGDGESGAAACGCRFVDTEGWIETVERVTGRELTWFFDVYVRRTDLPVLRVERDVAAGLVRLRWETGERPFPLPVEVTVNGRRVRISLEDGAAAFVASDPSAVEIDPVGWITMVVEERAADQAD